MTDVKKIPNPIDLYVGSRLRRQRLVLKMSQTELAEATGVTFQQIQKYERGLNRISASRLYTATKVLKVPVSFFFHGYEEVRAHNQNEGRQTGNIIQFINGPDGAAFARALSSIHDNKVRKKLLELARTLAG